MASWVEFMAAPVIMFSFKTFVKLAIVKTRDVMKIAAESAREIPFIILYFIIFRKYFKRPCIYFIFN